jgi:hypothetical protein
MRKLLRAVLIPAAFVAAAASFAPAANAAVNPTEPFSVCFKNADCNMGYAAGDIIWDGGNEPWIAGKVVNRANSTYSTTVVFEGYNGDSKVASDTRTARDGTKVFDTVRLPGIMNRIKITVCQNFTTGRECGSPENYSR